jgi:hypothetical protein
VRRAEGFAVENRNWHFFGRKSRRSTHFEVGMKTRLLFSTFVTLCASLCRDLAAEVRGDWSEVHEHSRIEDDRTLLVIPSIWLAS